MGKNTSAPPAPNGQQLAQQQAQANAETAITQAYLNNVNQKTPYGTLRYDVTGNQNVGGRDVPTFTASQDLSPEGQRLLNTQMSINQGTADLANRYVQRIGDATAKPFSYDGMPAAPTYDEATRTAARDRIVARQEPVLARQEDALRTRLANQGLVPGSEAYTNAMRDFNTGRNDYYLGADAQAGNEAGMIFGLQGASRDRAINEAAMLRSQPINEVSALMGTGTGVQNPSFVNTPQTQVAPTDTITPQLASYQGQMNAWQQGQQNNNALMGSIFGLAGAGLGGWARGGFPMPSDARIKENVERIATAPNGLGIYTYNHIGDPTRRIGLMAQEVEKVHPDAVVEIGGIKHVYYDRALSPHAVEGDGAAGVRVDLGDSGIASILRAVRLSGVEGDALVGEGPRHHAADRVAGHAWRGAPRQEQRQQHSRNSHVRLLPRDRRVA